MAYMSPPMRNALHAQVSEISGPAQTFNADFYLDVSWDDASVQTPADLQSLRWSPRLEVSNSLSVERVFELPEMNDFVPGRHHCTRVASL